jgi:hypothetical protein
MGQNIAPATPPNAIGLKIQLGNGSATWTHQSVPAGIANPIAGGWTTISAEMTNRVARYTNETYYSYGFALLWVLLYISFMLMDIDQVYTWTVFIITFVVLWWLFKKNNQNDQLIHAYCEELNQRYSPAVFKLSVANAGMCKGSHATRFRYLYIYPNGVQGAQGQTVVVQTEQAVAHQPSSQDHTQQYAPQYQAQPVYAPQTGDQYAPQGYPQQGYPAQQGYPQQGYAAQQDFTSQPPEYGQPGAPPKADQTHFSL